MDAVARARAYYRALDEGDYEMLSTLLAPEFVQERPDRTFDGRERFVQFMRDERPDTDTTHAVDAVYVESTAASDSDDVVVRGRLLDADGAVLVRFVDVFAVSDDGFDRLDTFTQ